MAFFFFGEKKFELGRGHSLSQIPLFSTLNAAQIRFIERKIRLVEYKKGDYVYREGEKSDAFYVIVSGRIQLSQSTPSGTDKTLGTLCRGDYFGEISLLTEQKHSVNARARNDVLLLRIDKEQFHEILKEIPPLSLHLSRAMGVRLTRKDSRRDTFGDTKFISAYHIKRGIGKTVFLHNLASSIVKETNRNAIILKLVMSETDPVTGSSLYHGNAVTLSDLHFADDAEWKNEIVNHPNGFATLIVNAVANAENIKQFITLMSHLLNEYNYVMVDLPRIFNELVGKIMEQSDVLYLLTDISSDSLERTRELMNEMGGYFKPSKEHVRIVTVESPLPEPLRIKEIEKLLKFFVFQQLPYEPLLRDEKYRDKSIVLSDPELRYSRVVRYLAREVGEVLVGLALGSGAAFGIAHVGVIKVLEEEGIHVDVVAGTSIGSFIGALWASGMPVDVIDRECRGLKGWQCFFKLLGFFDFSVPPIGFVKGNKIYQFLKGFIGNVQFRDLKKPLLISATNLLTSEEMLLREGEVARAVRASISIPGIFKPVLLNQQYLIDGGVSNPLPVQTLLDAGVKKVIAVNVLFSPEDHLERNIIYSKEQEEKETDYSGGGFRKIWLKFLNKFQKKLTTNIFNVLMNTIQFMEYTVAKAQSMDADVVIRPIVPESSWADFFKPDKFIEMGEIRTREQLPEIKRLMEES